MEGISNEEFTSEAVRPFLKAPSRKELKSERKKRKSTLYTEKNRNKKADTKYLKIKYLFLLEHIDIYLIEPIVLSFCI